MRPAHLLWVVALSISCSGCALFEDASRNTCNSLASVIEAHRETARNRQWAETAWQQACVTQDSRHRTSDYAQGFKDGYAEYLFRGGDGEPPLVAPAHYRDMRYQNPQGYQAIEDWFAGYRHGAGLARDTGARKWITGPSALASESHDTELAVAVAQKPRPLPVVATTEPKESAVAPAALAPKSLPELARPAVAPPNPRLREAEPELTPNPWPRRSQPDEIEVAQPEPMARPEEPVRAEPTETPVAPAEPIPEPAKEPAPEIGFGTPQGKSIPAAAPVPPAPAAPPVPPAPTVPPLPAMPPLPAVAPAPPSASTEPGPTEWKITILNGAPVEPVRAKIISATAVPAEPARVRITNVQEAPGAPVRARITTITVPPTQE